MEKNHGGSCHLFQISQDTEIPIAVTVPAMFFDYPPTFERDLDLADAPDPPTDNCPTIEQKRSIGI